MQAERVSAFRRHFDSERTVVENAAQIRTARITLQDIAALEDQLRLALSQMGAAHRNAIMIGADLTEVDYAMVRYYTGLSVS
jgi:hypothetical protein